MSPRSPTHRIEITLSDERLRALDEARGNEARASFIKRATDKLITNVTHADGSAFALEPWQRDVLGASVEAGVIPPHVERRRAAKDAATVYPNVPVAGHPNVSAKPAAARKPRPKGKH